ncbi:MAG: metal ABC transporter permease [Alphaproteobacteria bacterium]|nr:metal ABC transporter permease [Alphaproteobacteria bacterium]
MTPYDALVAPFVEYGFLKRALVGCLILALGSAPIGVLLVVRRMSLVGDAMAHAVLPGAAIGFLFAGFSVAAMTLGGLAAGLAVAIAAGLVARATALREDASFAAFYLVSLAGGVLIVSLHGSNIDLLHVLFGTVLALNDPALFLMASITSITLIALALFYRLLIAESFDPAFLRLQGGGAFAHVLFLTLVVLNLVGGFHALGTLMVVGLMMLPAAAARFWADTLEWQIVTATLAGMGSSYAGLLLSLHADLPASPSIILSAGAFYLASVLFGPNESLLNQLLKRQHLEA